MEILILPLLGLLLLIVLTSSGGQQPDAPQNGTTIFVNSRPQEDYSGSIDGGLGLLLVLVMVLLLLLVAAGA